jgi:hypothetical protein
LDPLRFNPRTLNRRVANPGGSALPLTKVRHEVAFNTAHIAVIRRFAHARVNLLPQLNKGLGCDVCEQVCAVCQAQTLSVAGLVIDVAGAGDGVFEAGLARALSVPAALSELVAALVKRATAAAVDNQLTVTQVDAVGLTRLA